MKTTSINRARRRIAMRIAEGIQSKFLDPDSDEWDVDEAMEFIAIMLPSTTVEAEAEMASLGSETSDTNENTPSRFAAFKEAFGADGLSILETHQLAIARYQTVQKALNRACEILASGNASGRPMDIVPAKSWQWFVAALKETHGDSRDFFA